MVRPDRGRRRTSTWPWITMLVGSALALGLLAGGLDQADAADIVYLYDRLGRLIAVVDPASDTAVYSYDAVGNLLSIARQSSSTVAIVSFDPPSGPVGATVTIQGTGFSATPAQNTVTFNGVSATVSGASANQLVITVPPGATTGTIGVTAPGGSATSTASFTVTTSSGSPTITGFTPAIGAPGTAVSITGTNFETTPANNRLKFNVFGGPVSSATTTTLSATVPSGATSGRLSVITPGGTTQSADDFFVPPSGSTAADVGFTGRATIGGSGLSVSMTSPGKIALVVFDGTAGQAFAAGFSSLSISRAFTTLFRPDGGQLATGTVTTTTGDLNSIHTVLPVTGTYTLLFSPYYNFGWQTGTFTLTLSEDPPAVPITINGAALTVTITRPGQHQAATFTGTTGQRLSLAFTSVTATSAVTVSKPDGTTLATAGSWDGTTLDLPELPSTGTYTIWLDPMNAATGSVTLTLSAELAGGAIAVDGASSTVSITRPGQNARLTFSGTAGQRLDLGLTANSIYQCTVSILKPDGTSLTSVGLGPFDGTLVTPPLPTTGTYSIVIDPYGVATGGMTLYLSQELTGSITVGGASVPVSITRPGQRARLHFSGTASQRVSMQLSGSGFPFWGRVYVLRPDESSLGNTGPSSGNFMNPVTLPSTSTDYALFVDPSGNQTGSVTIQLYDVPPDITGPLTINGTPVTLNFTAPGQKASFTFSATNGQPLTIVGANNTLCFGFIFLDRPGSWGAGWSSVCANPFNLGTSGSGGTHTLSLDPGTNTGSVDLSVTSP